MIEKGSRVRVDTDLAASYFAALLHGRIGTVAGFDDDINCALIHLTGKPHVGHWVAVRHLRRISEDEYVREVAGMAMGLKT